MSEGKSQAREGRRFVEVDKPGFVWRYDGATREGVTIEKRMNRSPSTSSSAKPARCQHVVRPSGPRRVRCIRIQRAQPRIVAINRSIVPRCDVVQTQGCKEKVDDVERTMDAKRETVKRLAPAVA